MDKLLTVGAANTPGSCTSRFLALAQAIGVAAHPFEGKAETLTADVISSVLDKVGMADAEPALTVVLKDGVTELEGLVVHSGVWQKLRALAADATGLAEPASDPTQEVSATGQAQGLAPSAGLAPGADVQEASPTQSQAPASDSVLGVAGAPSALAPGESGLSQVAPEPDAPVVE